MALEPVTLVASGEVELAVYAWGEAPATPGARPVIVLVHGYPDAASVWASTAERLAEHHHVIAYDVRGAGQSSVPDHTQAYALDHLVADLATVVDAMSPDQPVHLVCHDWGSIQSWEAVTTERMAGRIASYTTISGPSIDHAAYWIMQRLKSGSPDQLAQVARQLAHSWYIGMFQLPALAPTMWKAGLDKLWPTVLERLDGVRPDASDSQRKDGANGVNLYRANFVQRLVKPNVRRTDLPVQLIVPRKDKFMVAEIWDDLPQWVPNLWRREADAGHWIQSSHPQLVADWVSEFVAYIEGADETPALARARVHARESSTGRTSNRHRGRLVVITGAGSGFGRETALLFAEHGADIVCVDINLEAAERTVELVRLLGTQAWARKVDVGSAEQMAELAGWVETDFGAPDIVVNNAGIGVAGSFFDTTDADWDKVLRVNLWGVIHGSKLFGRQMIKAGRPGAIVNVASMGGFTPSKSMSAYNTSKAAVMMLSDCLRAEVAGHGIHVATICPGLSITNITQTTRFVGLSAEQQAEKQSRATRLYQRRNLTPDKIAKAILDAVESRRDEVPVGIEDSRNQRSSRMAVTPITALLGKLPSSPTSRRASNTRGRLIPRKVRFDWSDTPVDWIPDHPFASHFINEINLLLPAGEFWFCRLYNQALPLITDDKLRDDVQMFIRQEAMHARAHGGAVAEYLNQRGIETESNTAQEDWLFENLLGERFMGRELKSAWAKRRWLVFRLGIIAAIEHMTCVLGKYAMENRNWDEAGADPVLLDLLRWHGAEEVEHRCVAFDLYRHLGGDYPSRYYLSLIAMPAIFGLWAHGAAHLMKQDPRFKAKRPSVFRPWIWLEWQRQSKTGMLPSLPSLLVQQIPFFSPWYNPVHEGSTEAALRYLEGSPAAAAAAQRERDRSAA